MNYYEWLFKYYWDNLTTADFKIDKNSLGLRMEEAQGSASKENKYSRSIKGTEVDVYDVLDAFEVTNPALQHLIKKALMPGERGHKDIEKDMREIISSAKRAAELEGFDGE